MELRDLVVLIRGGGEMASAIAHRLARCHLRVCITELPQPLAVRRGVSFCEAVYEGQWGVGGIVAQLARAPQEVPSLWERGRIPVLVDPAAEARQLLRPQVLVDATLAKHNLGTHLDDAPLVIGVGPGFRVGRDVHMVVETNRGHALGLLLLEGEAQADTGTPGDIGGYTLERVLRAPQAGLFRAGKGIGDSVRAGEAVAFLGEDSATADAVASPRREEQPIRAQIGGVLRGLLRDGLRVEAGTKVGDIDPRGQREHCFAISDKARAIAGGVLEGILLVYNG